MWAAGAGRRPPYWDGKAVHDERPDRCGAGRSSVLSKYDVRG